MKKIMMFIVLIIFTFFVIFLFNDKEEEQKPMQKSVQKPMKIEQEYLKGVWVSTVFNLDFPKKQGSNEQTLKDEIDEIIKNSKEKGITDIFFQVRPTADAFYNSEIFPTSVYLTGNQDVKPQFDVLEYFTEQTHANNMKLHAWINPYRITKSEKDILSENHIAMKNKDLTVTHTDGNLYFNPALPEVRELVVNGVLEILENYDVDGIHLDDYFYPSADFDDNEEYIKYGNGKTLDEFRRDNVTMLISDINSAVNEYDPSVEFGVSPFGIWANQSSFEEGSATKGSESYFKHYADTKKWVEMGILDYIAPQIYWEIGFEIADYEILLDWWSKQVEETDVKLYIGHANYKESQEIFTKGEIDRQIEMNKKNKEVDGSIFFRYENIIE